MPDNEENKPDDGREIAATIFDGAATTAGKIAEIVPDPIAKAALSIGEGIAAVVGALIRSVGTAGAEELINELVKRRDEGVITASDLEADDASIAKAVSDMYKEDEDTQP